MLKAGKMEIEELGHGLIVFNPKVFEDERGEFFEAYNSEVYSTIRQELIQDNQSYSKKGVLRGLHFQKPPYTQGKLVRVVKGRVLDVVVDLRKGDNYGKWISIELSGENKKMLWIPEGFAHGFLSLEDTIFEYKVDKPWNRESESGIVWNDSDLNIDWQLGKYGISQPIVSDKDKKLPGFASLGYLF